MLAAEAAVGFAVLFMFLEGWRRDFRVPVAFSRDALEYLMQVKGTLDNGWWWVHPRLSAPGVFEQIQFPSNTNVDQAIVWIVGLITRHPGLCINLSWMIMIVLSALIASRCLVLLGVPRGLAIPIGLLFGLSPYALYRNIDHFSLATYLVPIPCTVALLAATNRLGPLEGPSRSALMIGCVLIGFNYTYYAFFACFLILVASAIAFAADRNRRNAVRAAAFVGAICLATAVNLAPSFVSWARHGKPVSIPEKHAAEAEQYGLKIRHLVSPVLDHRFPPFRYWTEGEDAEDYAFENENKTSRLGVIGTVGFIALLCGLFTTRLAAALRDGPLFVGASRLTLAALLLGTIGGFGSLFNLLISPEIRAYNRITPFISFFSVVAIALIADKLTTRGGTSTVKLWMPAAVVACFLVGLYDQSQAARPLNREHDGIRQEWAALGGFVRSIEERLPDGAMVFQLPVLTYLNETGREKMQALDHIKPYVASSRVRWSYPALSDSIVRWQQQVGRLPTAVLATAVMAQGFRALLIDRNGYADRGDLLMMELDASSSSEAVIAKSDRYIALDLQMVRKADVPMERLPQLGVAASATTGDLAECGASTAHNLEWIGGSSAPFARRPVSIPFSGEFVVAGWAIDERNQTVAADIDVVIGGKPYPAFYGLDRPDVDSYFGVAAYRASGFVVRLSGETVGRGMTHLSLRILAADRSCYYQTPVIPIMAQ